MAELGSVDSEASPSRQTSNLPINIEALLKSQGVEKQRLEFKKSWHNGPTKFQVVKTISAFANDFFNDNGGYIVIGVEEDESEDATSQIKFPPLGVEPRDLEKMQKEIMGACKGHIRPSYTPILSPEIVDGKHVLVIWAQASDNRPHKARSSDKGEHCYFIRKGVETTKATDEEIKDLLLSSAKVPFDDRMARHGSGVPISSQAINKNLVRKFLDDIQSNLEREFSRNMLQKLNLVDRNGDEMRDDIMVPVLVPKNVALLMFNEKPHFFFHGAQIEIAQFSRDKEILHERIFRGPLDRQVNRCIDLVLSTTNKEKSVGSVVYPERALREAIVNAVYHRGYEPEYNSPTKIYIRPHCLEIHSCPGPHQSLKQKDFTSGIDIPHAPARNRRIGEFLKEMKLAEARCTGVNTIFKTMKSNNNPDPQFDFDSTYFRVTLPAHPKFQAMMLLQEIEELVVKGETSKASEVLQEAFDKDPSSINQSLIQKLISLHDGRSDHPVVQKYAVHITETTSRRSLWLKDLEKWLSGKARDYEIMKGVYIIKELVKVKAEAQDLADVTRFAYDLSKKRDHDTRKPILRLNQNAHLLLEAYGDGILSSNSTIAWYFACIKYNIYTMHKDKMIRSGFTGRNASKSVLSYLTGAKAYLKHAIVISEREEEEPRFLAFQYRQLGYILYSLLLEKKATTSACKECYEKARKLDPKIQINSLMEPPKYA